LREKVFFFEKRSKKLLSVLALAFPDRLGPNEQKFFGSFFQKRTASFTWKDFRVSTETRYISAFRPHRRSDAGGSEGIHRARNASFKVAKPGLYTSVVRATYRVVAVLQFRPGS
jgi:hypothetical protein